jgi:hypothetical protein
MIMIVYAREPQGINTQVRFDFKKKIDSLFEDSVPVAFFPQPWPWITEHHGIGVWPGGGQEGTGPHNIFTVGQKSMHDLGKT